MGPLRDDDEEIHIAGRTGFPSGNRAEQDHPDGADLVDDRPYDLLDSGRCRFHNSLSTLVQVLLLLQATVCHQRRNSQTLTALHFPQDLEGGVEGGDVVTAGKADLADQGDPDPLHPAQRDVGGDLGAEPRNRLTSLFFLKQHLAGRDDFPDEAIFSNEGILDLPGSSNDDIHREWPAGEELRDCHPAFGSGTPGSPAIFSPTLLSCARVTGGKPTGATYIPDRAVNPLPEGIPLSILSKTLTDSSNSRASFPDHPPASSAREAPVGFFRRFSGPADPPIISGVLLFRS